MLIIFMVVNHSSRDLELSDALDHSGAATMPLVPRLKEEAPEARRERPPLKAL